MDIHTSQVGVFSLLLIATFESICYGMVNSFITTHLTSLGATQTIIGYLACGNLIFQLFSEDIVKNLSNINGKKFGLLLVLVGYLMSYVLLTVSTSHTIVICTRYLYASINQCQKLCRELLFDIVSTEEQDYYLLQLSILNSGGIILGPVVAGHLYSYPGGFMLTGIICILLSLLNILFVTGIPRLNRLPSIIDESSRETIFEKCKRNITCTILNLKRCHFGYNWDMLTIKLLSTTSMLVFFTKFRHILKHNFNASSIDIGYTMAYQNFLTFAITFYTTKIKHIYLKDYETVVKVMKYSLLLYFATVLTACVSPLYEIYIMTCIPMITAKVFINLVWKDLFNTRSCEALNNLMNAVDFLVGATIPIAFGVTYSYIQSHAVTIYSTMPILTAVYLSHALRNKEDIKNKYN